MRSAQGAVGNQTNPQLKLAAGFFDTLDHNAERYVNMGREVFAPTLESLKGDSDEQPAAVLLANGQKVVKKAMVFKTIAGYFKKVSFIFGMLPVVLLGVTLILFVLAIKPTLMEIIKLPATVAAGTGGADGVVKRAMRRVGGELVATICTLGVLIVLSMFAGFVMGKVVEPMLDTLITCFARALDYLQFVEDASAGMVGLMLFSVILAPLCSRIEWFRIPRPVAALLTLIVAGGIEFGDDVVRMDLAERVLRAVRADVFQRDIREELEGRQAEATAQFGEDLHQAIERGQGQQHDVGQRRRIGQSHGRFDDDAKGAFRANHQMAQVVAAAVLDQAAIEVEQVAVAGDQF